jgi:acyl-CoA synthetase (AMP-forming)/AMP-acid ligase II
MNDSSAAAGSMVEVLQARAGSTPDRLAFCFLVEGEEEGPRLTYGGLDRAARTIAATLQDTAEPGDRALLLYPPGLEFITAFFGCLYAGIVPVPAYPPRLDRLAQSWQVLSSIVADCQPRVVLTCSSLAALAGGIPSANTLRPLTTDGLDPSGAHRWRERRLDGAAPALLQYTSGATASPKGVVVTHHNLMHNQRLMQAALGNDGPGLGICWLPLYHDMGLIGGVLQPIFHGTPCLMLSPLRLLQKPFRWLHAISRYRAATSAGPNFAYDWCVERLTAEEKSALDLSSWSLAVVGAEPVSPRTLERFADTFAPCGFRPEALSPCYGLAEATLFVTGGSRTARPVVRTIEALSGRSLVGCGHPWLDQRLAIAHPESRMRCSADVVGEVWVAGPSVAQGYWDRPDETEHTFCAFLQNTGEGPFLRTGDLGIVQDGELFLTGRLKDVIIIRGRNHYPEDIEATVQAVHPALRAGAGAAFETEKDGQARLVVVQEVDRRWRTLDAAGVVGDVRQAVAERHELQVHDVQLLAPGSLPRTSSGKVQRHACRIGYEQGTLRRWKGKGA